MKATLGVALIFVLTIPKFAIAQDDEQAEIEQTEAEQVEADENARPIEQIDIVGERSLVGMRYQIRIAESTLYNLFNELNKVEKYHIRCRNIRRTGTYIPTRSCEPKFYKDFRQEAARFGLSEMRSAFNNGGFDQAIFQRGLDLLEPESELRAQVVGDYEGMQQEMFRIATENEDYLQQLLRVGELKSEYDAARAERFGKTED
ncbi:MAG: hypothetical protein GKR91_05150 [Pseudomonadales bacterium]|nr:hypothetical protein [Pseudomonadales bacterium]